MESVQNAKTIRGSYRGYSRTNKKQIVGLIGEKSLRQVSREYKIPEATLRGWKRKLEDGNELLPGKLKKNVEN